MKNKLRTGLLCFLCALMLAAGTAPAAAVHDRDTAYEARSIMDGIVSWNLAETGSATAQEWLDGPLAESIGIAAEWYVLALQQSGAYDFSVYRNALTGYLAENNVASASSRQKFALTLMAIGGGEDYVAQTCSDSIGRQGVLSWIFGLHLLNNGGACADHTAASVTETLLSLQLADGGWALTGTAGDVDVTAMALQALAPHAPSDPAVQTAVDAALTLLSARQTQYGGFTAYGAENPESAAQVIIALSALGIDCETDSRFIKNGTTIFENLRKFRLADGSFCHTEGGESADITATMQVFCAMTAYLRMTDGAGSFYLFSQALPADPPAATTPASPSDVTTPATSASPAAPQSPVTSAARTENGDGYRIWATAAIVGIAGILCLVLFFAKKRHPKNMIAVFVLAAAAVLTVWVTDFRSTGDYYGQTAAKENAIGSVTITIRCDTVAGQGDSAYIPADGVILAETEYMIAAGDTVFDILTEAAREHGIHMEYSGSGTLAYVTGIHYLYEFAFGDLSGWVYRVNGAIPSEGCADYALSDGDTVEWLYSLALGNDLH